MSGAWNSVSGNLPGKWEQLFEAVLLEDNPALMAQRLRDARDAIMDHIEDSFDSATSVSERQFLLAALSVIGELDRSFAAQDTQRRMNRRRSDHAT